MSRYRDPQLQGVEKYSYVFKLIHFIPDNSELNCL